jgi:D-glycero-alpha-D-manno-heptose-7-phosphate kinase
VIVTRTPLRISFAGGGTDFHGFYEKEEGGVVSAAIDKYIYIIIKARFDDKIRLGYSSTEMVEQIDDLQHELVREAMRKVGLRGGVEISTMADIPSEGSGLGSSSSVTVGVLHALYAYQGELVTAEQLAKEACEIEIDILGKPIGKQDQYIAAYGGLRSFRFCQDGSVSTERLKISDERLLRFSEQVLLFFTGRTRQSSTILTEQKSNIDDKMKVLSVMRKQADEMREVLESDAPLSRVGRILHAGWQHKKGLASGISSGEIDSHYESALDAGAIGGKVAGAGGGGFLLLFCPPDRQASVREALKSLKELTFQLDRDGSKVIFNVQR